MEPLVVLVTCPGAEEGSRIAQALVDERLAACVNLVPAVQSVYRWRGAVERADEVLLIIKTTRAALDALIARVGALHSYTVPEVLALPIAGGAGSYLRWLEEQVRAAPGPPDPPG